MTETSRGKPECVYVPHNGEITSYLIMDKGRFGIKACPTFAPASNYRYFRPSQHKRSFFLSLSPAIKEAQEQLNSRRSRMIRELNAIKTAQDTLDKLVD